MDNRTITEIYRDIGLRFHSLGADSVILTRSVKDTPSDRRVIDIAVSGIADMNGLRQKVAVYWPDIDMEIFSLDEDPGLMKTAYEDGIIL